MARALRRREAADYIGVKFTAFHALINAGEIPPGTRLGGAILVWHEDELEAFLDRKRRETRGEQVEEASHV